MNDFKVGDTVKRVTERSGLEVNKDYVVSGTLEGYYGQGLTLRGMGSSKYSSSNFVYATPFKVGDIVTRSSPVSASLDVGGTYTVSEVSSKGTIKVCGFEHDFMSRCFTLGKEKENMSNNEFEVGDRVRRNAGSNTLTFGKVYTVAELRPQGHIKLEGQEDRYLPCYFDLVEDKKHHFVAVCMIKRNGTCDFENLTNYTQEEANKYCEDRVRSSGHDWSLARVSKKFSVAEAPIKVTKV